MGQELWTIPPRRYAQLATAALLTAAVALLSSCKRSAPPEAATATPAEPEPRYSVVFPPELRADDPAIDALLDQALTACAEGDYDAFRLLWTAREDPVTREQFDYGWQALTELRVLALERLQDQADGSAVYLFCVRVQLDPAELPAHLPPRRYVVLMARHEEERWCLARAPAPLRAWALRRRTYRRPSCSACRLRKTSRATSSVGRFHPPAAPIPISRRAKPWSVSSPRRGSVHQSARRATLFNSPRPEPWGQVASTLPKPRHGLWSRRIRRPHATALDSRLRGNDEG